MTGKDTIYERHIRPLAPIATGVSPYLAKMDRFSAMLFDVYGTLLISRAGDIGYDREPTKVANRLRHLLLRSGINLTPDHLSDALNLAIARTHAIARGQGIDFPEVDIVQVWQQVLGMDDLPLVKKFALEYELIVNPVYPMPGLEQLLIGFKNRKIPMGIISNAQFYTVDVLERFLGATLERGGFDHRLLFFSWREGHAKPSTVMFKRAKEALLGLGIPAGSVLVVGNDMRNDILPARAVGFKTALFAGDRRSLRQRESDDCCRDLSPDLIVTDLRQLIAGTGDS
ncbi:HAD family hydrolase [uncultured Desulfosarcina sp.]|uniref:HAD family hydrolase n=1 Tax=uncultured Desulfosarcina sp. TaxID=218289 RepID=UPI0029C96CBD|nr:HAD family hydrolase [uncultured Desulfosarcina sp.]